MAPPPWPPLADIPCGGTCLEDDVFDTRSPPMWPLSIETDPTPSGRIGVSCVPPET